MNVAAENIDYGRIPTIEVARKIFGIEDPKGSTRTEKHFPNHGGLYVNIEKNRWYCHSEGKGGDAIDLIRFEADCDFRGALDWLRSHGFEAYAGAAPKKVTQLRTVVARYDYTDTDGELLYQVIRVTAIRISASGAQTAKETGSGRG